MKAAGRARVSRSSRGWRVRVPMLDPDGSRRVFVARHDTHADAVDHADYLARIGH